jgi:hypothetical protein
MALIPISKLAKISPLSGNSVFPIVQDGTTYGAEISSVNSLNNLQTVTDNGNITTNEIFVSSLSAQNSVITDTLSATTIHAVSSFVEYIDIKQYELSGFDVTGNVSVSGNMNITENITLSGNLGIDGLVDGRDIAADGIAIDNLETDVIFLSGAIDNTDADVIFLSGAIDNTDADVIFLSGAIDNTDADVAFLSGSIDNTDADVIFLSGAIDNTDADVIFLSGAIDNTDADVAFLSGSIDNTDADVAFLSGEIDNIDLQQVTDVGNTTTNSLSVASLTANGKIIGGINNTANGNNAAVVGGTVI